MSLGGEAGPSRFLLESTVMSPAEILAQLPRLTAEERAEVQAKLDELSRDHALAPPTARVATPRLADPRQMADFQKRVTELRTDAAL